MKTAISVDDDLLMKADSTAQGMGISRSRLFSIALENYLRERRKADILERLNKAYAGDPPPDERRMLAAIKKSLQATIKRPW
jgi:predicted transcriptional regulator